MSTIIDASKLDFDSLRASFISYLESQDQFKDFNFAGSNISVLLDLLTHNTHLNAFYLNMLGSEMFLDTAQLKDSVVSHAKELNYTPRSKRGAVAYVDIQISGIGNPDQITLQEGFQINGRNASQELFVFSTDAAYTATAANNFAIPNVPIYEGYPSLDYFVNSGASTRYLLSSKDVDVDSIKVDVATSNGSDDWVRWERATGLFGLDGTREVYFVQAAESDRYELVFGNGTLGKAVSYGNVVRVTYRRTSGEGANGISSFTTTSLVADDIGAVDTISVVTIDASYGGAEPETLEEIREAAPRYFTTQERAVTAEDYKILIKNAFPMIESVIAYGGEDLTPPQYGKAFIAAKPNYGLYLSENHKAAIAKFIKQRTPLSIDPVVLDPDYINVTIDCRVKYNPTLARINDAQVKAASFTKLLGYADGLSDFGRDIRHSKLLAQVDSASVAILSNEVDLGVYKTITALANSAITATVRFSNELTRVYSSPFSYLKSNSVVSARLESSNSALNIIDSAGVVMGSAGSVDLATGAVSLTSLDVFSATDDVITLYATLASEDVEAFNNQIIVVNQSDINVTVSSTYE